jgi:KR domain/Phosphopantetheine attachment site
MNLHEATLGHPLDFFTMTSSIVSMIAPATQASYTAANSFQDAFARFRVSQGLPALSISLGLILEVGLATRLPEVEKSLVRNGVYGTGELSFLRLIEGAFVPQCVGDEWKCDPFAQAHLLTGLEACKLLQTSSDGLHWHADPRVRRVLQSMEDLSLAESHASGPQTVLDRWRSAPPAEMRQLVTEAIVERLAKLLFLPVDEIDVRRAVSSYGIDSMIAAELRNWLVKVFAADISFLELLSPTLRIELLVDRIIS